MDRSYWHAYGRMDDECIMLMILGPTRFPEPSERIAMDTEYAFLQTFSYEPTAYDKAALEEQVALHA